MQINRKNDVNVGIQDLLCHEKCKALTRPGKSEQQASLSASRLMIENWPKPDRGHAMAFSSFLSINIMLNMQDVLDVPASARTIFLSLVENSSSHTDI